MVYDHCLRFSWSSWLHLSQLLDMSFAIEQGLGKVVRSGWQPFPPWDKSFLKGMCRPNSMPITDTEKVFSYQLPKYFLNQPCFSLFLLSKGYRGLLPGVIVTLQDPAKTFSTLQLE